MAPPPYALLELQNGPSLKVNAKNEVRGQSLLTYGERFFIVDVREESGRGKSPG